MKIPRNYPPESRSHATRPQKGVAEFTAKGRLCKGATCIGMNKAGVSRTPESFDAGSAICRLCASNEPDPVKPVAKPPKPPVVKPAPIVKPGQGVQAEKATMAGCSACGTKWDKHDGLAKTCGKLGRARTVLGIIQMLASKWDETSFNRKDVLALCEKTMAEINPLSH